MLAMDQMEDVSVGMGSIDKVPQAQNVKVNPVANQPAATIEEEEELMKMMAL